MFPVMHLNTKTASRKYSLLLDWEPAQVFQQGSNVIKFSSFAHNSTGEIYTAW